MVVSIAHKLAYAVGNLSYSVILQLISSFFVFYATSVLHISGSLTGFLVFLSVVWDAITDPLMGYISDNTRSMRFGKRHLYMIIGIIGLCICNTLLWSLRPEYNYKFNVVAIFLFLMLCKTFITVFSTPHVALGAEMTTDYNERTSIQTFKSAFFLVGLALPTVLGMLVFFRPTAMYPQGQLNPDAYLPMGIGISLVSFICAMPCIFATTKYMVKVPKSEKREKFSYKKIMSEMVSPLKLRECRYVIFGYLFQNVSTAIVTTLNMHVFTYTFHLTNTDVSIITGVLLVASVMSQSFWFKRTVRRNKRRAMLEALVMAGFSSTIFLFLVLTRKYVFGNASVFIPFSIIMGYAMGGMISIPQTMLVDTIDLDEYISGKRKEGSVFGCMTFFYKLSQSATIFLTGIFLDLIGFDASLGMQSDRICDMLGLSIPIAMYITLGLGFYCFKKYSLTKEKVLEIQQNLRGNAN